MIFSHWYFCSCVKLDQFETAEFLNIISILEERYPAEAKLEALSDLASQDELKRSYSIPVLVELLLSARSRHRLQEETDRQMASMLVQKCKQMLHSLISLKRGDQTPLAHSASRAPLLTPIINKLDKLSSEDLSDLLKDTLPKLHIYRQDTATSYLESDIFCVEILLLSMLRGISETDPALLEGLECEDLMDNALDGSCGELPYQLALEISSKTIIHRRDLLKLFPADWIVRPYCIRLMLNQLIYVEQLYEQDGRRTEADAVRWESRQLEHFRRCYNRCEKDLPPLWIDERLDQEDKHLVCAILWQAVAFDMAFSADPLKTFNTFNGYWQSPIFIQKMSSRSIPEDCSYTQKRLLMRSSVLLKSKDPERLRHQVSIALCSPWQKHADPIEGVPFSEFPHLKIPFSALRSFAAASMLQRVMLYCEYDYTDSSLTNFYRVMMTLCSCLMSGDVQKELYNTEPNGLWSRSMRGMALFAARTIHNMGTGRVFSRIPQNLMRALSRGKSFDHPELAKLMGRDGFLICAHWAVASIRAHSNTIPDLSASWLKVQYGHKESSAHELCRLLFLNHYEDASQSQEALELLCQCNLDELEDPRYWSGSSWIDDYRDWLENSIQDVVPITASQVLLSRPIALEEWNQVKLSRKSFFTAEAWPIVHTMRMRTMLHTRCDDLEQYPLQLWYAEWNEAVAGLNTMDMTRAPILLYLLCDLMKPVGEGEPCPALMSLTSRIFGQVHDLVYNAASDHFIICADRINQYLSQREAGYPYTEKILSELQLRTLQRLMDNPNGLEASKPMMYRFIAACADRFQDPNVPDVSRAMSGKWSKCVTNSSVRTRSISPEQWDPLTDRFLMRKADKLLVARPVQNLSQNFWNGTITNGFSVPVDRFPEKQSLLGIIVEKYGNGIGAKYKVNCGTGELLDASVEVKVSFSVGDFVSVMQQRLEGPPPRNKYIISSTAWANGGSDEVIQVRNLEFQIRPGHSEFKLRLPNYSLCQVRSDSRDPRSKERLHRVLDLWCPNIDCYLTGNYMSVNSEFEAVYDSELQMYVPVARSFPRLLMEKVLDRGNADRRVRLTLIRAEEDGYLFSAAPGQNYHLRNEDWLPGSLERFVDEIESQGMVPGLIIHARLHLEDGAPCLEPDWDDPVDRLNLEWAELFNEDTAYILERDSANQYWIQVEFRGKTYTIKGQIEDGNPFRDTRSSVQNVQLASNGWDRSHQRERLFGYTPLRSFTLDNHSRTAEEVRRLIDLRAGDVMTIADVMEFRNKEGYHRVRLSNNMMVYCAPESLSMLSDSAGTQRRFRRCIVEYIYAPNFGSASDAVPDVELPALETAGDVVRGVVAKFIPTTNQSANVVHTVWFEENGVLFDECQIPAAAFQIAPWGNGAVVLASRQENGLWSITCENRNIYVRALWQLEDHTQQENPALIGLPLARNVKVPGHGFCLVTQDRSKPVLHLWNNAVELVDEPLCGLSNARGIVSRSNRRRTANTVFPYARWTDVVHLRQGNTEFWGESEMGKFAKASKSWSADLLLESPVTQNAQALYDIRRVFHPDANSDEKQRDERNDQLVTARMEAYREWLEEEQFPHHVVGTIQRGKLILDSLRVPARFDLDGKDDEWTNEIEFLPDGDKSWVTQSAEHRYSSHVRAVLKLVGNVWFATCREAQPYQLDQVLAHYFRAGSGEFINQQLCYAGLDEEHRLRFEWGVGYCFVVRPEDVIDSFGNQACMDLFYGDRITGFKLIQGAGEFGWQLCISADSIQRGLPHQVWTDSNDGIIQMLKIRIDRSRSRVSISEVTVTDKSLHSNMRGSEVWRFRAFYNGLLDHGSIHRLLSESGPDTEERTILAELVPAQDHKSDQHLIFSYLPLDHHLDPKKLLKKTLCLVAGSIQEKEMDKFAKYLPANDYMLRFYLPDSLPADDGSESRQRSQLTVRVLRRSFSLDESKLRVLYSEGRADEYHGNNMLVKLIGPPNNNSSDWNGSVVEAPVRANASLKEWLKSAQMGIVVLGKPHKGLIPLEVAPGILCQIPEDTVIGEVQNGATATVRLVDEEVRVEVSLPSDRRYFPKGGRPAELLPKDDTIAKYNDITRRRAFADPDHLASLPTLDSIEGNHFTVAGFPQIQIRNSKILDSVMQSEPPRVIWINSDVLNVYQTGPCYRAVRLLIQGEIPVPYYRCLPPCERTELESSEWNRISFRDDVPHVIAASLRAGRWHYHDKETAVYKADRNYLSKRTLQKYPNFENSVFFLNEDHNLRVRPGELLRYGYSLREITEYGLPRNHAWYPIAHADDESIWIELMPGRVLELPKKLLAVYQKKEADRYPLINFYSRALAPGDLIRLVENRSYMGGQRQIMVSGFRFGIRSAFGAKRNHLPVLDGFPGSHVVLGCGRQQLIYPTTVKTWQENTLVNLDDRNRLFQPNGTNPFYAGDTVMLKLNENGDLVIAGYDHPQYIRLSNDQDWHNAQWLCSHLRNRTECAALFVALGGSLIAEVGWSGFETYRDKQQLKVRVSISFDDLDRLPEGTVISGEYLGMLNLWNDTCALIRVGKTLLRVDPERLIPGTPFRARAAVSAVLAENRQVLWLHKKADGWYGGLPDSKTTTQRNVRLLYPVEAGDDGQSFGGFLCMIESSFRLCWLPAKNAARAKATVSALWSSLSGRPQRTVQILENGSVSLIDTSESRLRFAKLKRFPAKYRAVIHQLLEHRDNGTQRYLAELYPMGNLIYLDSETPLTVNPEDPIPVELIEIFEQNVTAIPYGTHLNIQRIPEWINASLAPAMSDGTYHRSRFQPPRLYDDYQRSMKNGFYDGKNGYLLLDFKWLNPRLRPEMTANIKLCYLAMLLSQRSSEALHTDEIERAEAEALTLLKSWMHRSGYFISRGFDNSEKKFHQYFMDLPPVISAILLLDQLSFGENAELRAAARRMAVHMTRIIGLAADSSIHVEVILRDWLMCEDLERHTAWRKLAGIDLCGRAMPNDEQRPTRRLSQFQCAVLKKICDDICQNRSSDSDVRLKLVANSLLYSIGELKDYKLFGQEFQASRSTYYTSRLAALGHALTPPASKAAPAVERLSSSMRSTLLAIHNVRYPLCIMTEKALPLSAADLAAIRKDHQTLTGLLYDHMNKS